jgi:hypothetical protein
MSLGVKKSLRQVQQRYCVTALSIATIAAVVFILAGYHAIGKGLLLGTFFSMANFTLMAILLPLQFNPQQNKSTVLSLGSILIRFGLMAVPLIVALKSPRVELSAAVVGLFGVQIVILGDHLWTLMRDALETRQ